MCRQNLQRVRDRARVHCQITWIYQEKNGEISHGFLCIDSVFCRRIIYLQKLIFSRYLFVRKIKKSDKSFFRKLFPLSEKDNHFSRIYFS